MENEKYTYKINEWIDEKEIPSFLESSELKFCNSDNTIYNYKNNGIYILNNNAKLGDGLNWQDISYKAQNVCYSIRNLIVNNRFCIGFVTSDKIDGIVGKQWLNKLNELNTRKSISYHLVNMYNDLSEKNIAYTNWCLEDIIATYDKQIKLINPQFLIDLQDYPNLKSQYIDYNFCLVIFSILYGVDFSIVNSEEIPDLNIPEIIKDVLNKKKNEKITFSELNKIIRLTQKEFVYQPQIQKLIRKFSIPSN